MKRAAWALAALAMLVMAPAGQARARDAAIALHYNLWCFNVLFNYGVRHGNSDSYHARMATYAMADARTRALTLAQEAAMSKADFDALDKRYFESAQPDAAALAASNAEAEVVSNHDGCRSRGLRGIHAEKRHAAFLAEREEQMWCQATMMHFTSRKMIGGGPERAERGASAARALKEIVEHAFVWSGIAPEDRDILTLGVTFRSLVQVEAFAIGGSKEKFERDYEPCFAMADLPLPQLSFDFPPAAEVRPSLTPAAWDYPLSFEFRQNIWCRELVRQLDIDPLIARNYTLNDTGKEEVAAYADTALAAEATALSVTDADFEAMSLDKRRQVAYEFKRFDESKNYDDLAYDFGACTYLGAEEQLDDLGDLLFGPVKSDDERLDEAMWCLAAFEYVFNSPTGRPPEAARRYGFLRRRGHGHRPERRSRPRREAEETRRLPGPGGERHPDPALPRRHRPDARLLRDSPAVVSSRSHAGCACGPGDWTSPSPEILNAP